MQKAILDLGQGLFLNLITMSKNKSVKVKRYSNRVKGSAIWQSKFSCQKPVLQIHTKIHGITLGLIVKILISYIKVTSLLCGLISN